MTTARSEVDVNRLGDVNPAAGANKVSGDMVPAAQLCDGDSEAVGDGYESVSVADTIESCGRGLIARSDRNDDSVDATEIGGGGELVDFCNVRD